MTSASASILHADLDAFYAAVEQRDNPGLLGRPVVVGEGVVLAASYEAKRRGVRTAMGAAEARRLCPDAVVVAPRMDAYSDASKAVFDVFHDTTPLVEGLSIDEAFLDVSGLRRIAGRPDEIAACRPYLDSQLDLIDPRVVVTLGRFSSQLLLDSDVGIGRLRGKEYPFRNGVLVPTFHPAAVLRGGGEPMAQMRADLVRAKRALTT